MDKRVFAVDVDGVLLRLTDPVLDLINRRYGLRLTEQHITCWRWMPDVLGLTNREQDAMWDLIWSTPAVPYPGSLNFIESLQKAGYIVHALSNRTKQKHNNKQVAAAERDFPGLGVDAWTLVPDGESKSTHLKRLRAAYLLDDKPLNVVDATVNSDAIGLLMDRPWNKGYVGNLWGHGIRVRGYEGVLDLVK
jgi:hypothetical protein